MTDEDISVLESVANILRGMTMDPRIPEDARACLRNQFRRIDKITAEYTELDEDDD